jgi:hypothetical protein
MVPKDVDVLKEKPKRSNEKWKTAGSCLCQSSLKDEQRHSFPKRFEEFLFLVTWLDCWIDPS